MMKGFFASLHQRILAILLLAGLPIGILLLGYVWQAHNQSLRQEHQLARTLVTGFANAQDDFIKRTQRFLKRLAEVSAVQQMEVPACDRFLKQFASINEDYLNLAVARPDGELVCSAQPLIGRVNVADRGFIQQALSNRNFTIGSYQIDRASKTASLGFAYPVVNPKRGRISGIAIAVVSLEAWSRRLGGRSLPPGATVVIVDVNNTIVAHYPYKKRVIGLFAETYGYSTHQVTTHVTSIIEQSRDAAGKPSIQAYKSLHVLDDKPLLTVGISLPMAKPIETSWARLWQGLALTGLAMLTMFGVMHLGLKRNIIQPLRQLVDYTKALGQGRTKTAEAVKAASELKALQEQITVMANTRLATESDLRVSEDRFRLIAETMHEVFWVVTPDWKEVIYVNPAYEYIWQQPIESLYRAPDSWLEAVVQEDRQMVIDYIAELEGSDYSNILFPLYRIERRDGTIRWISAKGFAAYDAEGELTSVVGIAEDVTERKQYEVELSEREAKYRLLVEYAEDLVVKVDTDGHFLFVSPSYCRTFGKSEHQLLGKAFMPLVHQDDQAATAEAMKQLYYPPFSAYMEQRAMTAEGWRWFGWSDKAVLDEQQEVVEIIGVGRDITQQKQTELALRESETRNRELVDNMSDGVTVYQQIGDTAEFLITNINHAAERMMGCAKEQVVGRQVDEVFPGVKELGLLDTIRQVAKEGKPIRRPVSRYRDQTLELLVEYYVFKLPSGELVAVFRDATAEQRAIEALRGSEEKFRGFFEDISVGLVIADRHGVTLEANKAFAKMFGFERRRVIGASLQELLGTVAQPEITDKLLDLENGRLERYRFQATYRLAADRKLIANVAIGVLQDDAGKRVFLYGIAEDVTALEQAQSERIKLQRELMRTYRLEALGRLAGGIAHDFNNILGAIGGFVELAASRLETAEPQQILGYLNKSMENSERAKQLIKQLLIFSRGPEFHASKPQDFGKVVAASMDMIRSLLPSSITFDVHLEDGPHWVICDPVQIEQVLLNLCINARDAMDGKGRIDVSLEHYLARGDRCVICSESVHGDWISLSIKDSGKGITDTDLERIFEPFFTTKEREKGTGLGLSVVHGIVSSYEGHILVDSDEHQGTGFHILFPAYDDSVDQDEAEVAQAPFKSSTLAQGTRLLVVDDETAIQQLLKEALVGEGYEVEVCNDGEEAWRRLQDHAHPINLLITDQTMPHLSGLELVSKLRDAGDSMPVVLCTGFSELVTEQALDELEISSCLAKPVKLDHLKSTLQEILLAKKPSPMRNFQ